MQNSDEQQYQPYERAISPVASFVMRMGGLFLALVAILALVAGWQSFLTEAPTLIKVFIGLLLLLATGTLVYLAVDKAMDIRHKHRAELREAQRHDVQLDLMKTRIHADERGNRPAVIVGGQIITLPSGNFVQNVPQTYSPHIQQARGDTRIEEVPNEQAQIEAPAIEQPNMQYVLSQLEENALQVCLGVNATTGKPFVLDLLDGVHYKFIGSSGMGKSCMAGSILEQATKLNSPDNLMISLLDLEHKTSRLFENLPHVAQLHVGRRMVDSVATDADEVATHLGYLRGELDRRKVLSEYELNQQRFMLIYVEEFLSLRLEVDDSLKAQMLADFSILAVRGRKYGMYLLACAQDDYADDSLKSAKNQFRVKGAFGIPPTAAQSAGFVMKDLIKQNYIAQQKGQYVLETSGCMATMLAPVYDVKAKLARLAPARTYNVRGPERPPVTGTLAPLSTYSAPLERDAAPMQNVDTERAAPSSQAALEHVEEVKRLRSMNWNKEQIIKQVWNATKGSSPKYKSASADYDSIVAQLGSEN